MKKITELTYTRLRTVESRDEYGNIHRDYVEHQVIRPVQTVAHWPRLGHAIVDGIIFRIITLAILGVLAGVDSAAKFDPVVGNTVAVMNAIIGVLLTSILYAAFEFTLQRTPGKYLTRTLVINEYGLKPELKDIILRSLVRLVPFEAISCLSSHPGSYGWHDRWTKTWVVKEDELAELWRLQIEQSIEEIGQEVEQA